MREAKTIAEQFEMLDRQVFSAFTSSFNGITWNIEELQERYAHIDLQVTASTKNDKRKTYDIELKSRPNVSDMSYVKDCYFELEKWYGLCEYDNDFKLYVAIYPSVNKILIWNVNFDLLKSSEKTIQKLKSSTAGKHRHIVEKQVFKLKREDAIEFDFDLSEWRKDYNALYLQATKS